RGASPRGSSSGRARADQRARRVARMMRQGVVGVVAASLLLAGCAAGAPDASPLEVEVIQPRTGIATGVVAMRVTNVSEETVVVASAELESTYLGAPLVWSDGPVTFGPGRTID